MSSLTIASYSANEQSQQTKGRALLSGAHCLCGNEIKAEDLVAANFDKTHVHTGGGLYLVQTADGWRGCRRMTRVPDGIAIDLDCDGDWATFARVEDSGLRVVGTVESVYRPTHYG